MAGLQEVLDALRDRFAVSTTTAPINAGTLSQPSTLSFIGEDVAAAAASAVPVAPTVAAPGARTVLRATGAAQSQFLYFDSLHPTSQAHALLASGIAQGLTGVA